MHLIAHWPGSGDVHQSERDNIVHRLLVMHLHTEGRRKCGGGEGGGRRGGRRGEEGEGGKREVIIVGGEVTGFFGG